MDLRSERPFWPVEAGLIHTYPVLRKNEACQVAIVGAGITGALLADRLSAAGVDCVILEKRDVGGGSTSASTGLVQYEIDKHLMELAEMHGEEKAARAYRLCWKALDTLETTARSLGLTEAFQKVPSLYLASTEKDAEDLEAECDMRRRHGMEIEFWSRQQIEARFPFSAPAALWSGQAGQMNPYRFTHALLKRAVDRGTRIYDRTCVERMELPDGGLKLVTLGGRFIEASQVVFATGYELPECLDKKIVNLNSTYALVSEPEQIPGMWPEHCLIWETARPYLYMRTIPDGRVLIGGGDERFKNAKIRDALIAKKAGDLLERYKAYFPGSAFDPAYCWAGTFGETADGLGYIGPNPECPHAFFCLGYGGNGITYGVLAADLLCDLLQGIPNSDAELFSFQRRRTGL